jgi:hypothetical protein
MCDTRPVGDEGRRASLKGRIIWTLVAVATMFLLGHMTLPGVNRVELAHIIAHRSRLSWGAISQMSVIALGLGPLVTAFGGVELLALAVPRLRPLRHTPEGRRKLAYGVAATAIFVALLQGHFTALYLQALDRGGSNVVAPHMEGLITITLVGGTMFLVWLVSVINRRGLGNGYAVLMVAGWLMSPNWLGLGEHSLLQFILAAIAIAVVVAVVIVMTRMHVASEGGAPIPLPSSAMLPISNLGGIAIAFDQLLVVGLAVPVGLAHLMYSAESILAVSVMIVVGTTVLWSWLFARPSLRRDLLVRAGYAEPELRTWLRATLLSAVGLGLIFSVMFLTRREIPELGALARSYTIAFITMTLLDVFEDAREHGRGLVAVWPIHDPMLAQVARDALRAAEIPHYLQSARLRSLLWFFGPYVPIMVMVPADHAVAAEKRLRELLVPQ